MLSTCDAQAQDQIALLLHRRRRIDRFLADVAGRVGVGNVIAHHLQADLHRPQRVAAKLDRAEKTHAPPAKREGRQESGGGVVSRSESEQLITGVDPSHSLSGTRPRSVTATRPDRPAHREAWRSEPFPYVGLSRPPVAIISINCERCNSDRCTSTQFVRL